MAVVTEQIESRLRECSIDSNCSIDLNGSISPENCSPLSMKAMTIVWSHESSTLVSSTDDFRLNLVPESRKSEQENVKFSSSEELCRFLENIWKNSPNLRSLALNIRNSEPEAKILPKLKELQESAPQKITKMSVQTMPDYVHKVGADTAVLDVLKFVSIFTEVEHLKLRRGEVTFGHDLEEMALVDYVAPLKNLQTLRLNMSYCFLKGEQLAKALSSDQTGSPLELVLDGGIDSFRLTSFLDGAALSRWKQFHRLHRLKVSQLSGCTSLLRQVDWNQFFSVLPNLCHFRIHQQMGNNEDEVLYDNISDAIPAFLHKYGSDMGGQMFLIKIKIDCSNADHERKVKIFRRIQSFSTNLAQKTTDSVKAANILTKCPKEDEFRTGSYDSVGVYSYPNFFIAKEGNAEIRVDLGFGSYTKD